MNTEKTKLAVWVSTSGGKIPDNAIRTGYEKDGKLLFIARAKNERQMDLRKMWTLSPRSPHPLQLQGNHRKKL